MWWSKQAQTAAPSFSPSFSSTATIDDPPVEIPVVEPAKPRPTFGDFHGRPEDDLHLDAAIDPAISVSCGRLTIGENANATADVIAREVIVYGRLRGNLRATESIEIKKNAWVTGELVTPRIRIEEGAYFKGTVQIERRKKTRAASQSHM